MHIFSSGHHAETTLHESNMAKKWKLFITGLICAFSAGCGGGNGNSTSPPSAITIPPLSQYTYTQPFDTSINITDGQSGQILGSAGYNTNSNVLENNDNFWSFMQWGNPENLLPIIYSSPGTWQLSNTWASVKFYPDINNINNVYELATTGMTCPASGTATTENNELDLFLQPSQLNIPKYYISDMGQLELSVGLNFVSQAVQDVCPVNRSGMVAAFTLANGDQTIFIQIDLGGTDASTTTQLAWCPDYEGTVPADLIKQQYKNLFCVDDNIANYGGAFMQAGDSKYITLDILPRLQQILQSGHTKPATPFGTLLYSNLDGWYITGYYFGLASYGGTTVTTQWYSPEIRYSGGTSCTSGASTRTQWVCETPVNPTAGWVDAGGGCYYRTSSVPC